MIGTAGRRVVVTGIGVVTPVGTGVRPFWSNVVGGASGVGPIQAFDAAALPVRIAAEVSDFSPTDWMSRKESLRLDRFCQFGLAAADLAVTDAGLPGGDREDVATVVGSAVGGAATIYAGVRAGMGSPTRVSPFFVPSSIPNMAAALIAQRHRFLGPCVSPASACATSADAIGQGYRMVREGYARACLAGGTEASVLDLVVAGFANLRALSTRNEDPHDACRPFDADRDGFVLGEGAAMLVLEPLQAAVARGAHVYAEVCGYGQTNDGYHMTAPDPAGTAAARAMRQAVAQAGLEPSDVDYVNAHGTATWPGDPAETAAMKLAFGDHSKRLAVSSTKAVTGHLLGAAGATEAAICALAIERGQVPPTINHRIPDPACDLDVVPGVARELPIEVAMSNSLAFGGHNVSLVLRRYHEG